MEYAKRDVASEDVNRGRDYPQSPTSTSPSSSRRGSLITGYQADGPESPTPTSPPLRLTRKRAAPLNTDAANHPRIGDLALNTTGSIAGGSIGDTVCLCQPDPKIPRPRNAFILYRQHYQAQVVARHPGLANPEISKIIGEQWRNQPIEVKNNWKRLAEEEKKRHQRQYPDYRFQPRRAGTQNRNQRFSSSEDPSRCPKCNGRYISTPSTPVSPYEPIIEAGNGRLLPPFTPSLRSVTTFRSMTMDDHARFPNTAIGSPRMVPPHHQFHRRPGSAQQNLAGLQLNAVHEHDDTMDVAENSPEMKRRRFNNNYVQSSPSPYDSGQHRYSRPPTSAVGYVDSRRSQLPGPGALVRQRSGMMDPPPRPSPGMHQYPAQHISNNFDESLRLPPLHTQMSSAAGPGRMNIHQRADSQARGIEAMVMTIPYPNKIKVLSKISPALAPAGATSPVHEVRGAIIAVEGADSELVAEVGEFIRAQLKRESDYLLRTWSAQLEKTDEQDSVTEVEMTGSNMPSNDNTKVENPFADYLSTMQAWHVRSNEIIKFVTTAPSPTITPVQSTFTISPMTASSPVTNLSSSRESTPSNTSTHSTIKATPVKPKTPIALLPTGFSLSISDQYAISTPINDAYAPVDHWQWMATLWRGIVGPDLTIYVKSVHTSDREGTDEMARYGGVELRKDCAAVIVRVAVGKDEDEKGSVSVEEKTLRRLGFEVLEILRSGLAGGGSGSGKAGFGRA